MGLYNPLSIESTVQTISLVNARTASVTVTGNEILEANENRKKLLISNVGNTAIKLEYEPIVTVSMSPITIQPGGIFYDDSLPVYKGAYYGAAIESEGLLSIREFY